MVRTNVASCTLPQRQTKDDEQPDAVLIIYELAERLADATKVLEEFHSILSDDGSSNRSKVLYVISRKM